ncbi:hypothetical protein F5Y07DRAFT_401583 [Xylaria sp. FL0933]|nr:hypothetical protein F5Y07DRAFT_401583 [Xylaria sp. FL0933]
MRLPLDALGFRIFGIDFRSEHSDWLLAMPSRSCCSGIFCITLHVSQRRNPAVSSRPIGLMIVQDLREPSQVYKAGAPSFAFFNIGNLASKSAYRMKWDREELELDGVAVTSNMTDLQAQILDFKRKMTRRFASSGLYVSFLVVPACCVPAPLAPQSLRARLIQ